MLDNTLKTQLSTYLQNLKHPLELSLHAPAHAEQSESMRELLDEVAQASSLLRVVPREHALAPSFGIGVPGQEPRIRFAATPTGHEFSSLVLALLHAGGHPVKEDSRLLEQVLSFKEPLNFDTFMSLSCHNCPEVVQALNTMAALNPHVTHTTYDIALYKEVAQGRDVMSVPAVFLNGELFSYGRMDLAEVLSKLKSVSPQQVDTVQEPTPEEVTPFDVLVIGGGPAGAAAALYAARKGIRTGILCERFGGQTNDTMDIENFVSVVKTQGPAFSRDMKAQLAQYGVVLIENQRIAKVQEATDATLAQVHTAGGRTFQSKTIVLATGARWKTLGVPGEDVYRNKGVAYCPHCDGPLFKGQRVAVVGGGNSGVEAAIDLAGIAKDVVLLEFGPNLRADAVLVKKLEGLGNVRVITSARTSEVLGDGRKVVGLQYEDMTTKQEHQISLEGIFVQIGLSPNTEFLKGTLNLNRFSEIEIDAHCRTSSSGIFAAGDATNVAFKQIVIAAGEGAKAALSAFDYLMRKP